VSGTTSNIGLAEIEVYEVSAGAPVANNACAYTPMNTPVSGALSATDPEGQALTYSLATQGGKGSVNLDAAGNYAYTPNNPNFRGLDMFTYNVTDTEGNTSTGSVWVIIDGVIRFMPLGDSITAGSFSLPSLPFSEQVGYRRKLYLDLEGLSPNYSVNFVGSNSNGSTDHDKDNEGHGGGCATGPCSFDVIDTNIVGWLNANPADIVLLHIGINDINQRGDTSATGVTNILNAIDTWEAANHPVTVLLAKIIDDVPNYQTELNVTAYNNNLVNMLAGRPNDRVIMVDMRDGAGILYGSGSPGPDMFDNVHPNLTGYNKMADKWKADLISSGTLPSCP
jgi:VCBS repeat-containing protein